MGSVIDLSEHRKNRDKAVLRRLTDVLMEVYDMEEALVKARIEELDERIVQLDWRMGQ